MLFFKCILISDVNIEILGIQLSVDIILTVYSLYSARKERYSSIVFKYINISDINIEKIFEILPAFNLPAFS